MIKKHAHQLRKVEYKNHESIYFCVLDCDYKVNTKLALGKVILCPVCKKEFALNEYSLRLVKPKCSNCVKHKINPETIHNAIEDSSEIPDTSSLIDRLRRTMDGPHNEEGTILEPEDDGIDL